MNKCVSSIPEETTNLAFSKITIDYLGSYKDDLNQFIHLIQEWYKDPGTRLRLRTETEQHMHANDAHKHHIIVLRDEHGAIQASCGHTTCIPEDPYQRILIDAYGSEIMYGAFMSTRFLTAPFTDSRLRILLAKKVIIAHLIDVHSRNLFYGISSNPDELAAARSLIKSLGWENRGHEMVTYTRYTFAGPKVYQQGYQMYTIYLNDDVMQYLHSIEKQVNQNIENMGIAIR